MIGRCTPMKFLACCKPRQCRAHLSEVSQSDLNGPYSQVCRHRRFSDLKWWGWGIDKSDEAEARISVTIATAALL